MMESRKIQYVTDETQLQEIFNQVKQEILMREWVCHKPPVATHV